MKLVWKVSFNEQVDTSILDLLQNFVWERPDFEQIRFLQTKVQMCVLNLMLLVPFYSTTLLHKQLNMCLSCNKPIIMHTPYLLFSLL